LATKQQQLDFEKIAKKNHQRLKCVGQNLKIAESINVFPRHQFAACLIDLK
jgi:hypothetical protein